MQVAYSLTVCRGWCKSCSAQLITSVNATDISVTYCQLEDYAVYEHSVVLWLGYVDGEMLPFIDLLF